MSCDDPKDLLFRAWKYQGFNYLSFEGSAEKSEGTSCTCKEIEETFNKSVSKKVLLEICSQIFFLGYI